VTVTGAGFRNTAALSCRVGRGASAGGDASTAAVAASARWLSATAVECVLPVRAAGNATLHVSNDGVVFSAAGARVEALAAAAPVTDAGVALGGTAVYRVRVLRVEPSQGWPSSSRQLVSVGQRIDHGWCFCCARRQQLDERAMRCARAVAACWWRRGSCVS